MKKLLSFIIPVYNVAQYLDECIDSIMIQMRPECEIILVNDGSTDGSGEICDRRACCAESIRVIHQQNSGVAAARNTGINVATGEYLAFVDSDDRIVNGAIQEIINWIQKEGSDICFMQADKFFTGGRIQNMGDSIKRQAIYRMSRDKVFSYLSVRPKYPGSACTKIFRKEFLDKNGLYFPTNVATGEDLQFVLHCLMNASTFDALEVPYYEYRQNRMGSVTQTVSEKSFFDLTRFIIDGVELLTIHKEPKDMAASCAMSFLAYEYSILLWQYSFLTGAKKTGGRLFLKEYHWVLEFGRTHILKIIRIIHMLLGTTITAKLLAIYMQYRRYQQEK